MSGPVLTACQDRAFDQIMSAYRPGARHLLTGYAGTGKTYLMSSVADMHRRSRRRVVLTAPDAMVVMPGHGPETTIGVERVSNPFLRDPGMHATARGL